MTSRIQMLVDGNLSEIFYVFHPFTHTVPRPDPTFSNPNALSQAQVLPSRLIKTLIETPTFENE
jgi:hypothetical protein